VWPAPERSLLCPHLGAPTRTGRPARLIAQDTRCLWVDCSGQCSFVSWAKMSPVSPPASST
jgi:hypothetical protein